MILPLYIILLTSPINLILFFSVTAKVGEKCCWSMFTKVMKKTGGITQKSCELVTYICDIKLSIHKKYNTFTQTCLNNF